MKSLWRTVILSLSLIWLAPLCIAKEVVDTKITLSCSVSGIYADGSRIKTGGVEEISIDIKRINWNDKEPAKPPAWGSMSTVKIKSNGQSYDANLLKSTKNQVAVALANDANVDRAPQTLSITYEISLDKKKLRRTVMTLFSSGANLVQSSEGDCSRQGR